MEYKIKNSFLSASIKDFGAELCSLQRNGVDLEYMWQADENYWGRHSPILFPIVGKLLDDEYIYEDKIYSMKQHGFARDNLFTLHKQKEDLICFKLEQNQETLKNYPFDFELYISYELIDSSIKVSYKVVNTSKKTMPFSIGAHPAFNWPLSEEEDDEYYFKFRQTEDIESLALTKNGISEKKVKRELNKGKLFLDESLFKNDALIFEELENKLILLSSSASDNFIEVKFDDFEYLGLWSKPSGAPFICIEPWNGIADFIHHNKKIEDKKGIKFLKENESFQSSYEIRV